MKTIKGKKGFTLVECVVAMAVLAIMSLLLTMILSITLKTRNRSMELERDLDKQVEDLVEADGAKKDDYDDSIKFENGKGESFDIPGNSVDGVDAGKKYNDDSSNIIGKMEYDFEHYFEKMPKPAPIADDEDDKKNPEAPEYVGGFPGSGNLIRSTVNLNSDVTITEQSKTPIKINSGGEEKDGYEITWRIEFTTKGYTPEKAMRVILPIGAQSASVKADTSSYSYMTAKYMIRIQPKGWSASGMDETSLVSVYPGVTFKITKEDFDTNYISLSRYFKNIDGTGNSCTFTKEEIAAVK